MLVKNASLADAGIYEFNWIDHDKIRVALTVVAAPDPTLAATEESPTEESPTEESPTTEEESGRDKVVSPKPGQMGMVLWIYLKFILEKVKRLFLGRLL